MTIDELKKLIEDVPGHFEFEIEVSRKNTVPVEGYCWSYESQRVSTDSNNYDIGHSEMKMKLNIEISEDNF